MGLWGCGGEGVKKLEGILDSIHCVEYSIWSTVVEAQYDGGRKPL
jgi:hypothetical protein